MLSESTTIDPTTTPPEPLAAFVAAVSRATVLLAELSDAFPFDDPSATEYRAGIAANRIPNDAIVLAASILEADPKRFPDLDPIALRSGLAYAQRLGPLVLELAQLQQRAARTVLNRRGQAVAQTLALYGMLKGLSRVSTSAPSRLQCQALAKLLKTTSKSRATTVTKKELRSEAAKMRASKITKSKAAVATRAQAEAEQARAGTTAA